MARPHYETEHDRRKEGIVKRLIEEYHDFTLQKATNAHYDKIDYFGFNHGIKAMFEIKCRRFRWGEEGRETIMFSAGKWAAGFTYSQSLCIPFYIVISARHGGTYQYEQNIADVKSGRILREWGGRTDQTRDSGDLEPVMMIPIDLFTKISNESGFDLEKEVPQENTQEDVPHKEA